MISLLNFTNNLFLTSCFIKHIRGKLKTFYINIHHSKLHQGNGT
jgi:hypothetical protein